MSRRILKLQSSYGLPAAIPCEATTYEKFHHEYADIWNNVISFNSYVKEMPLHVPENAQYQSLRSRQLFSRVGRIPLLYYPAKTWKPKHCQSSNEKMTQFYCNPDDSDKNDSTIDDSPPEELIERGTHADGSVLARNDGYSSDTVSTSSEEDVEEHHCHDGSTDDHTLVENIEGLDDESLDDVYENEVTGFEGGALDGDKQFYESSEFEVGPIGTELDDEDNDEMELYGDFDGGYYGNPDYDYDVEVVADYMDEIYDDGTLFDDVGAFAVYEYWSDSDG